MSASIFPDDLRAHVREQVSQTGAPADQIDPIVDLSFHAVEQAIETMQRIIDGAPSDAAATVITGLAASILGSSCAALQEGLRAQTEARGGYVVESTYTIGDTLQ